MATLMCPHCHRAITPPASSGARLTCSHCQSPVDRASEKTSRWFIAHQNEKRGPYSWRALCALASRGDLDPDAMLIKEHSERWVRARTLQTLFTAAPAAKTTATAARLPPQRCQPIASNAATAARPESAEAQGLDRLPTCRDTRDAALASPAGAHRSIWDTPWVMESLAAATISVLLGVSLVLGYYAFDRMSLRGSPPASPEQHVASSVPDASR